MNRRHFAGIIAGTAALALPGAIWFTLRPTCTDINGHLDMRSIFGDSCQINEIGRAYRNAYPGEDDIVLLQNLLQPNNLSIDLDKKILKDFEHGNTVQLQGWILSRTEARRYALFSIHTD